MPVKCLNSFHEGAWRSGNLYVTGNVRFPLYRLFAIESGKMTKRKQGQAKGIFFCQFLQ